MHVRAETIQPIEQNVDGRDLMSLLRQPIRQPATTAAKVEDSHRTGCDHPLEERRIAARPHLPQGRESTAQVLPGQGTVILLVVAAPTLGATNGLILVLEAREGSHAIGRQATPD